jgi:hypothetical protein
MRLRRHKVFMALKVMPQLASNRGAGILLQNVSVDSRIYIYIYIYIYTHTHTYTLFRTYFLFYFIILYVLFVDYLDS